MTSTWNDVSFIGNFAAAADALGIDGIGIAWGIAGIPFTNAKEREEFLNALVMMPRTVPTNIVAESQKGITYPEGMVQ